MYRQVNECSCMYLEFVYIHVYINVILHVYYTCTYTCAINYPSSNDFSYKKLFLPVFFVAVVKVAYFVKLASFHD